VHDAALDHDVGEIERLACLRCRSRSVATFSSGVLSATVTGCGVITSRAFKPRDFR